MATNNQQNKRNCQTKNRRHISLYLLLSMVLSGCVNFSTPSIAPSQYSGFLGDYYTRLQPATSSSGQPTMRWISPRLQQGLYKQVVITPTRFYPEPKTSDYLYTDTLRQVLNYIDVGLYQNLSEVVTVVQSQTPNVSFKNTLRLQVVVSGVAAIEKGLQLFEEPTTINVEYKITDALTGEVLAAGMRKGFGKPLTHSSDVIALDDLSPVMDAWTRDAASFFVKMK